MRQTLTIVAAVVLGLFLLGGLGGLATRGKRTVGPDPLAGYTTPTEAEALDLAQRFAAAATQGDTAGVNACYDYRVIAATMIHDVEMTKANRDGFIAGGSTSLQTAIGNAFATNHKGSELRVGRTALIGAHRYVRIRFFGDDGIDYIDFQLARQPQGKVVIVDQDSIMNGRMIETSRQAMLPVLAAELKTPLEKLVSGAAASDLESMKRVGDINRLLLQKNHREAQRIFAGLPAAFRATRAAALTDVNICQGLGDAEHLAALERFEKLFPSDPHAAMRLIDAHIIRKDWAKTIACIDQIEAKIGADAGLAIMRGNVHALAGDTKAALAAAKRATEIEPDYKPAWIQAVDAHNATKDFAGMVTCLDQLAQRFRVEQKDFSDPGYADFCASPEYAAWRARAQ